MPQVRLEFSFWYALFDEDTLGLWFPDGPKSPYSTEAYRNISSSFLARPGVRRFDQRPFVSPWESNSLSEPGPSAV
jgi:hypothetical protein